MIKNIVLDVGKVLVAWEPLETMRKLGYAEDTVQLLGETLFQSGIWNETDRGVMSDEEFLALACSKAPGYEWEIRNFWENIDKAIWQLPYVKNWIGAMKKSEYQVYILSNYGSWTYEKTREEALNFLEYVDGAIFSYEIRHIKPEPEIFQTLFERFGIKAEESVFLDDLAANIEGARRMGMHGIVFTGLEDALEELKKLGVELHM